ncbi:hypothetical protein GCM10007876_07990 [Litoribrevibacter albus]|uniref:Tetratricopeptide repeat protein n=2 Tax=Litoribrevibacter albus TaxID=1473156 RepID=A0AA37S767_9GAMM|nr:hypothetical protein GCM10007876_07990 [Litoribrevibacter albus]
MKQVDIYNAYSTQPEIEKLFVEGKASVANQKLKTLVPDHEKTKYDYFVLGNMLFQNDFEASYNYMLKAEQRDPDNPLISFERAIHEHRLGNYAKALDYYLRYQKSGASKVNVIPDAYLTHVYLMLGQADKALESWKGVNFRRTHTAVEKAMYTIFSKVNQESDRQELISKIRLGEPLRLCDLHSLDSNWEIDWWNHTPKKSYLEYDQKLAESILDPASALFKYVQLCQSGSKISDQQYVDELNKLGFFSELPESSELIYESLRRAISTKHTTPDAFLKTFEDKLIAFSEKYPLDRKYFDVLAFLYSSSGNKEKLKAIDRHGWKVLKLEKYAQSYLASLDPGSDEYMTALDESLRDFPFSIGLNIYRLSIEKQRTRDAFIQFAAAQFANVKNNWAGPYRLNDYMTNLKYELEKLDK